MAKKSNWFSNLAGNSLRNPGLFGNNNGGGRLVGTTNTSTNTPWGVIGAAVASMGDSIKNSIEDSTNSSVNNEDPITKKVQDYAALLDKYGLNPGSSSSSSSSYGGGYAAPERINIQPMIDAFTAAATAQRNTLQTTANQQRTDLLNSIKRFQEETARNQEIQRDAFNASRADLEEAAFQADRANRISAAARGIGGSGLQQLAQLQTLMKQNDSISDLAKENTNTQIELARLLTEKEEDTNTAIQNLMANLANSLSSIDANLGSQIANLRYQEDRRYEEARQAALENALNRAASRRSSTQTAKNNYAQALIDYEMGLREQADTQSQYNDLVRNLQSDFSEQIADVTDKNSLGDMRDQYRNELYNLVQDNLISNDVYTSGLAYLNSAYNNRLSDLNNNKSSNNNNWLIGRLQPTFANLISSLR